ncbi:YlxR family protein [Antribacter sp. KLBMP9083]|uniref:YlxR family protein n=1 Tax=Antribacter soli TaxID=2910976 RepID=A0AA41QIX5_9MICO|nr:YlxR family protein [Antribacter soli]
MRLVLDTTAPQPRLVADVGARLPGRGAWVHPTAQCLELAERRKAVPRALRVTGPLDLAVVRAHLGL